MISLDDPRLVRLTDSVFVFVGYATSSAVVTSEGVLAIDSPMSPNNSIPWGEFIRSHGPLKYLVVTEHHEDHTVGSYFLQPEVIISSELTAREMGLSAAGDADRVRHSLSSWAGMPNLDMSLMEGFKFRRPTLTYSGRMNLELGGKRFVIFHAPGHTRGSTVVHAVDDRIAFVADHLRPQGGPPAWHSGDPWETLKTYSIIEMLDVDWFVPGHGGPIPPSAIDVNRRGILKFIDDVRQLRNKGWSIDRILEEGKLFFGPPVETGYTYVKESAQDRPAMQNLVPWSLRHTVEVTVQQLEGRHPSAPLDRLYDGTPYWWQTAAGKEG